VPRKTAITDAELAAIEITPFPQQVWFDVFTLVPHPDNYNTHPQSQIENLKGDLRRFGQRRPIVVQIKNKQPLIVAGHGLTIAFQQLTRENRKKWGLIWGTLVPETWTDDDVIGYLTADNETSRGAIKDTDLLVDILERQQKAGQQIASLGFTKTDYALLLKSRPTLLPTLPEEKKVNAEPLHEMFSFGTIRQVVFQYDVATYEDVLSQLEQIREQRQLETNADVLVHLLEQYWEGPAS
jgi:hypothetical protein